MKEKLLLYLHSFTTYDLIYFAAVGSIFILLIVLVLLARKKLTLALLLLLFAILELSLGVTLGFSYFHNYLYKNTITLTKAKRLQFVQAVIIEGTLKNESRFDFKECKVEAVITKDTHNKIKNLIFKLKPIRVKSIILEDIPKGADTTFRFLIEPFTYKKDFNVSVQGTCK